MQLNAELAAQIRFKARAILDREIVLANDQGVVLASDTNMGEFAAEALSATQKGRQISASLGQSRIEWCPFVYDSQTIGVFGVIVDHGTITPEAVSLLQGLAEVLVHQYLLLDRMQSTEVVRARFIRELLEAERINFDDIYRQADILQLNLRTNQAVILTHLSGFESTLHARVGNLSPEEQQMELARTSDIITSAIKQAFRNFPHNIVSYLGDDIFVVFKSVGGSNPNTVNTIRFLTEKSQYIAGILNELNLNLPTSIGIGQFYPDLGGLRKSYQDARLALQVGIKVWGRGHVYHIKQVGMFVTLANISQDRKAELAHQILHPLLGDEQLYKTVREFLNSGLNLTTAAERLHIHRNTLIYRLDKTKKLIGLDPRHFDDALQIKLGLMFYQT